MKRDGGDLGIEQKVFGLMVRILAFLAGMSLMFYIILLLIGIARGYYW